MLSVSFCNAECHVFIVMLSVIVLSVMLYCFAERHVFIVMLSVIVLSVIF